MSSFSPPISIFWYSCPLHHDFIGHILADGYSGFLDIHNQVAFGLGHNCHFTAYYKSEGLLKLPRLLFAADPLDRVLFTGTYHTQGHHTHFLPFNSI